MLIALQDTGDTRESPAIDICHGLVDDGAVLALYDPKVSQSQMLRDMTTTRWETLSLHIHQWPAALQQSLGQLHAKS